MLLMHILLQPYLRAFVINEYFIYTIFEVNYFYRAFNYIHIDICELLIF